MNSKISMMIITLFLATTFLFGQEQENTLSKEDITQVIEKLINKYGQDQADRIERGVTHMAGLWFEDDGTGEEFQKFCMKQFVPEGTELDVAFETIETQFEAIRGYQRELSIALDYPVVVKKKPVTELDRLFSKAGMNVDYYKNKLAFAIALNFPYYTHAEKEKYGPEWTRKKWAMVRVGDMFDIRIDPDKEPDPMPMPDELRDYHSRLIISMDHILSSDKEILFAEGTKLDSHHGLRDEIKSLYARENPLERQRVIMAIMVHIVNQTIPECMLGETSFYWDPIKNEVFTKNGKKYVKTEFTREPDDRYKVLHHNMVSKMRQDVKYPEGSTYLTRTFDNRQLSEEKIVGLLESVIEAAEKKDVAAIIEKKLGRKLEPFDIWYTGFSNSDDLDMDQIDEMLRTKYPVPIAFEQDLPNILKRVGFSDFYANFLGTHVKVDPVASGGHANGPQMRGAKAYLRTTWADDGLNFKGYRIGMHEIGHTVQQNVATYMTDYYSLKGIPSSPYTEAMADLLAYRNKVALGLSETYSEEDKQANALAAFWFVCELGADAIHEIRVWHWLYDNPDATVQELKKATIDIANDIWNEYFADIYGVKDVPIFAIYNHFLSGALYLHSYPLGNIVLMQLEDYFEGKDFATEMIRTCKIGRLTPDLWMIEATGEPLSSEPLLDAMRDAVKSSK